MLPALALALALPAGPPSSSAAPSPSAAKSAAPAPAAPAAPTAPATAPPLPVYEIAPVAESVAPLTVELPLPGTRLLPQVFPAQYSEVDGVLTFRGGPRRDGGAFGVAHVEKRKLAIKWWAKTTEGTDPWFGGAGWTGQPVIVRWPKDVLAAMPLVKVPPASADDFVEVIQGSLDGKVYFYDLKTGRPTRKPIDTGNPIKGSVSLDARGWPLLFVGSGIPTGKKPAGVHLYSLVTNKLLYVLRGYDEDAPLKWPAFDSSVLVNRLTDSFVVGGENGLVYVVKLNTRFDATPAQPSLSVTPEIVRYRVLHKTAARHRRGIETSLTVDKNVAWFANDAGIVQALDLRTLQPLWTFAEGDDVNATLTFSLEEGRPMLYTGNVLDVRGPIKGTSVLRKLDGVTGKELWQRSVPCAGSLEPRRREPGLFANNVVGSGDIDDLVIFMLSRCPTLPAGTLIALDKETGKEVWKKTMKRMSWSSTTAFKDQHGKTWLIQADLDGRVQLIDARTGVIVHTLHLTGTIEASPAIFENRIVITTRYAFVYGLEIR